MLSDIEKLRKHVEWRLTPERYHHSLCVQKQAMHLAKLHRADWYKAGVAGLLHDICHCESPERQLNYLESCGIILDIFTLENPQIWHAVTGSLYVKRELGVENQDVVDAIRYHTTGRAGMGLLEKVVYVADLTSEDRQFLGVESMRALSEHSLDAVMRESLRYTLRIISDRGKPLVPEAVEAYNYYIMNRREESANDAK